MDEDLAREDAAARWEAELAADRDARNQSALEARLARYGIPRRLWECVRTPTETPPVQAARRFLASQKWLLVLAGSIGSGKTAAASVAVFASRGRMVTATETTDRLFDREWWQALCHAPVLAIDDLGTEKPDREGYWQARWRALLDSRYRDEGKLIVTCNLQREVFLARYIDGDGGRTLDRVRDGGVFSVSGGESLRTKGDDGEDATG